MVWSRLCARAASASGVDAKLQGQLKQMGAILERAGKPSDPRYEAFAAIVKAEPDPIARTVTVAVAICGSSQPGAAPSSSAASTASPPSSRPGPRDWISMAQDAVAEADRRRQPTTVRAVLEQWHAQFSGLASQSTNVEQRALLRLDAHNVLRAIQSLRC